MPRRALWLAAAAVLVAVALAVLVARGCRPGPPGPPADFSEDGVRLVSPEIDLVLVSVRGTAHPSYTDWACLLECREARGCGADVKLVVEYRSAGEKQTLNIAGRLVGERGQTMRVGRAQRPAVAVDRIDRVTVEVVSEVKPTATQPTPVQ